MDFVIRYGPASSDEDEALALARRLFAHFEDAIDSLTLVPVPEDEFSLTLDDRLVHSRGQSGRAPRVADVLSARLHWHAACPLPAPCTAVPTVNDPSDCPSGARE